MSEMQVTHSVFTKGDVGKDILVGNELLRIKDVTGSYTITLQRLQWWRRLYRWSLARSRLSTSEYGDVP